MFEELDEAGLVATIEEAVHAEGAAGALRMAAIGELLTRRIPDPGDDERSLWACDGFDSTAAEVAAAMTISHGKACGQLRIAETLRDRLPKVAELFAQGRLSERVVSKITWRTRLIVDDAVWAQVDQALSERAREWGPLSDEALTSAADALVYEFDSDAVVTVKQRVRTRDFTVGAHEDEDGLTSIFGRLAATDAKVLDEKVSAMLAGVCARDPRSAKERRADAVGALGHGKQHLRCLCGGADCPGADGDAHRSSVVITVIADETAVNVAGQSAGQSKCAAPSYGTAVMADGEVVPTPLLAHLLANGAKVRTVKTPCDAEPEPRYRPSAKLAEYVRARDIRCRFPGCRVPAERCDIDHVVPYPVGPTHPSNLVCLCRKHHHLKTFWVGDWALSISADGAATWTSPTGKTYTTHPGCRSLFPGWNTTTGRLPDPPESGGMPAERGQKMPSRTRSRAAERATRIKAERAQNNSDPPAL